VLIRPRTGIRDGASRIRLASRRTTRPVTFASLELPSLMTTRKQAGSAWIPVNNQLKYLVIFRFEECLTAVTCAPEHRDYSRAEFRAQFRQFLTEPKGARADGRQAPAEFSAPGETP
jgi:hypothetical protein